MNQTLELKDNLVNKSLTKEDNKEYILFNRLRVNTYSMSLLLF